VRLDPIPDVRDPTLIERLQQFVSGDDQEQR